MPKYYELPDDFDVSALGEHAGAFKEYQPEDVSGLKDKANQLLTEKKTMESQLAQSKADYEARLAEAGKAGGDTKLQAQLDDALLKLKTKDDELLNFKAEIARKAKADKAFALASELTKDKNRGSLLAQQIAARIEIEGDNITVLDESGRPTVSSPKELLAQMSATYPFLVDGSQATGGNAPGGRTTPDTRKFSEYTSAELVEIKRNDPQRYERLRETR